MPFQDKNYDYPPRKSEDELTLERQSSDSVYLVNIATSSNLCVKNMDIYTGYSMRSRKSIWFMPDHHFGSLVM